MPLLAELLQGFVETHLPDRPSTLMDLSALVGNHEIAERAGVTVRTVERWLKAERGEPGQTRHPNDVHDARLVELRDQAPYIAVANAIRDGLDVEKVRADIIVSSKMDKDREVLNIELDPLNLEGLARMIEGGDYSAAAQEFWDAWADEYGMSMPPSAELTVVHELDISARWSTYEP